MIEPVPWMIQGGALHSARVGRSVAHMALGGKQGVAESGDLAVRAQSPASPSVSVAKGTFAIRNVYQDEFGQSYVGRASSETLTPPISPTTGMFRPRQ